MKTISFFNVCGSEINFLYLCHHLWLQVLKIQGPNNTCYSVTGFHTSSTMTSLSSNKFTVSIDGMYNKISEHFIQIVIMAKSNNIKVNALVLHMVISRMMNIKPIFVTLKFTLIVSIETY